MALSDLENELVDLVATTPATEQDMVAIVLALRKPEMQQEVISWLKNNRETTVSDMLGATMDIRQRYLGH